MSNQLQSLTVTLTLVVRIQYEFRAFVLQQQALAQAAEQALQLLLQHVSQLQVASLIPRSTMVQFLWQDDLLTEAKFVRDSLDAMLGADSPTEGQASDQPSSSSCNKFHSCKLIATWEPLQPSQELLSLNH